MEAGRELDSIIAEKVMGLELCKCDEDKLRSDYLKAKNERSKNPFAVHDDGGFHRFGSNRTCNYCSKHYIPVINYSTDIAAAWEVVVKLQGMTFSVMRVAGLNSYQALCGQEHGWIDGASAPHAICLAALKAIAPST